MASGVNIGRPDERIDHRGVQPVNVMAQQTPSLISVSVVTTACHNCPGIRIQPTNAGTGFMILHLPSPERIGAGLFVTDVTLNFFRAVTFGPAIVTAFAR